MTTNDTIPTNYTSETSCSSSPRGIKRKLDSPFSLEQPQHGSGQPSSFLLQQTCSRTSPSGLDEARDELLKRYVHVAEKSILEFLHDHVPHVTPALVEQVMAELSTDMKSPNEETMKGVKGTKVPVKLKNEGKNSPPSRRTTRSSNKKNKASTAKGKPSPAKEKKTESSDKEIEARITSEGKVRAYAQHSPAKKGLVEAQAFNPLCDFISTILELASKLNGCKWVAHSSRQTDLFGEKPHSSRPDSYLYLIPTLPKELGWERLLCVGEFKNQKTDDDMLDASKFRTFSISVPLTDHPRRTGPRSCGGCTIPCETTRVDSSHLGIPWRTTKRDSGFFHGRAFSCPSLSIGLR